MNQLANKGSSMLLCGVLIATGCNVEEDSPNSQSGNVSIEEENLSRTWMRFTYQVYLLDRFIDENGYEDYVMGSKEEPYTIDDEDNVVAETNFDFLEESGVVEGGSEGYSVVTEVDLDDALIDSPEVSVSVKKVMTNTVASAGEINWCDGMENDPLGYVESYYDAHQDQVEARDHMKEYIDSCGAIDSEVNSVT